MFPSGKSFCLALHMSPALEENTSTRSISVLLRLDSTRRQSTFDTGLFMATFTQFVVWINKKVLAGEVCSLPPLSFFLSTTPRLRTGFWVPSVAPRERRIRRRRDVFLALDHTPLNHSGDWLLPNPLFLRRCSLALVTKQLSIRCTFDPLVGEKALLWIINNKRTACGDATTGYVDQRYTVMEILWYLTPNNWQSMAAFLFWKVQAVLFWNSSLYVYFYGSHNPRPWKRVGGVTYQHC